MSMNPSPDLPLASVVIEWENVKLSEMDRCRQMLDALSAQIAELQTPRAEQYLLPGTTLLRARFEIIVLFDPQNLDRGVIEGILTAHLPPSPWYEWRLLAADVDGYYAQKNYGAEHAKGDWLVFIDSDVVPEPGWLVNLMAPLADGGRQVVAGHTFLDPEGLLGRTFALTWFFPLPSKERKLGTTSHFFANNVAFRRECFIAHPYRLLGGSARGACTQMAWELKENGIGITLNTAAQVSHAAPNGLKHYLLRGIAQGRDDLLVSRASKKPGEASLFNSLRRFLKWEWRSFRKILTKHRQVGMPFWQIPGALFVAGLYYLMLLFGDIATRIWPEKMKEAIQL